MPRKSRAELEVENADLRERLASIHAELCDYFDESEDDDDEQDEDEEEEE
jgi:hypothetical protein